MASNLVIAAIPADGDDVWKVSSEKKPHLTILFLGDAMSNPNVTKIADHVKDRSRSLEPFSLLVDHRGFLGSDEADVLFFTKDIPWQLYDFRDSLKYNQEISMAYNAIPQHQDWKPHLTLGYPSSPANSDDWDPMGTQYVTFDKIACWFGDYEGPEFPLTENVKPKDYEMYPEVAGWADTVGDILAHYGVKGMKWGVRRRYAERQQGRADVQRAIGAKKSAQKREEHVERLQTGKANVRDHARSGGLFLKTGDKKVKEIKPVSEDAAKAAGAKTKAKKEGKQALSNEEMQALITRMNLERQLGNLTPPSRSKKGAKFAGKLLANTGNAQLQRVINDQATKAVKKHLGV